MRWRQWMSLICLDICILILYFLIPILHEEEYDNGDIGKWLMEEARYDMLTTSLLDLAIWTLVRIIMFMSIVRRDEYYITTRFIVYAAVIVESLGLSLVLGKALYWWQSQSDTSFSRYRAFSWTTTYFWTLVVLFMTGGTIQVICILKLNQLRMKSKFGSMDVDLMAEMMRESKSHAATANGSILSPRQVEESLWKHKWRKLTRHFSKHSVHTFSAILQLYAHRQGAVEQLEKEYEADSESVEFYIPQLCTFLILGEFQDSPELYIFLLSKCSESHVFAQKMYWFLKAFCNDSAAYSSKEKKGRVQMLMAEIMERGSKASREFASLSSKRANSSTSAPLDTVALTEKQSRHYSTFEKSSSSVGSPFEENMAFVDALTEISTSLKSANYSMRNSKLEECLREVQDQFFPNDGLFLPIGNSYHRIRCLNISEALTFSTRERVPYLLCLEVIDIEKPRSYTGIKGRIQGIRDRLFNQSESLSSTNTNESHGNENSVAIDIAEGRPNQRPRSPDAEKLGFWSEMQGGNVGGEKPPSFPQASDIIHGFIDTIKGGGSSKETDSGDIKRDQDGEDDRVPSPPRMMRCDSTDKYLEEAHQHDMDTPECVVVSLQDTATSTTSSSSSSTAPPHVVFSERWSEKEERIQKTSPWGQETGWRLMPVIVKANDDLRQEQVASQLIRQFANIFKDAKLPVYVRPYDVIATSSTAGLVDAISDTISLDSLKRNDGDYTSLLDFFHRHFGDSSSSTFRTARRNFVNSMAAYSIICYLLQIKDRHNGNILLHAEGMVVHIDFGYILANNPGNMHFESAPFKLTQEFVDLMGGPRSASFRRFRSLCVRSFLVARKFRHRITLLAEMMSHGNEDLPCFGGNARVTLDRLNDRFRPELSVHQCEDFVHSLIDTSLDNWRTRWYDKYQRWIVGVY